MTKYYLAHPFMSRRYIREWELEFEKRTGIELINPFFDIDRPIKVPEEWNGTREERAEKLEKNYIELVETDLKGIKGSNGLVGIIDKSIVCGTIMEIVYAKKIYNKKVYLLVTNGEEKHPWLRYHSDKIFTNKEDLEEFLICQKNALNVGKK